MKDERKPGPADWAVLALTFCFLAVTVIYFSLQNRAEISCEVLPDSRTAIAAQAEQTAAPGVLPGERIDLNTAPAADLTRLPGIGPAKAEAIVTWREEHGPFRYPEQVTEVSGIGEATLEQIMDYITVGEVQ